MEPMQYSNMTLSQLGDEVSARTKARQMATQSPFSQPNIGQGIMSALMGGLGKGMVLGGQAITEPGFNKAVGTMANQYRSYGLNGEMGVGPSPVAEGIQAGMSGGASTPSTGNYGPQNPDAFGNSQYGFGLGSYDQNGSFMPGNDSGVGGGGK